MVHFSHRWRCVFNGIAALSFCVTAMPLFAAETAWKPRKTVEIVVGAQAAGANDRMGRMLHKILTDTKALPVPSVVVNKPAAPAPAEGPAAAPATAPAQL